MQSGASSENGLCSTVKKYKVTFLVLGMVFFASVACVFLGLFLWEMNRSGPSDRFVLNSPNKAVDAFGTCEEFKGEVDGYDRSKLYVPGFLSACAAIECEKWLESKCTTLEDCDKYGYRMPAYENLSPEIKHHVRLRWIMKVLNLVPEFQWAVDGGTLLGLIRHGDIIPHDHDVDIFTTGKHIKWLMDNFHKLPKNLNLERLGEADTLFKIVDMNSCMKEFANGTIGSFVDIFNLDATEENKHYDEFPHSMNWDEDVFSTDAGGNDYIQKLKLRGVEWGLQKNWHKLFMQEFKAGSKALTYAPFVLDNGMMDLDDKHCKGWQEPQYVFKAKEENGQIIRVEELTKRGKEPMNLKNWKH